MNKLAPCRKLCRYSTKLGDWRENICQRWRRHQFPNSMTWCRKWLRRGDLGSKTGHGNQNRVGHLKISLNFQNLTFFRRLFTISLKLTRKGLCEAYRRDEPGPWRRGAFLLNVGPNFLDENLLLFIFLCPVIVVLVLNMTFRTCSLQKSEGLLPDRPHQNRRQTRHLVSFELRPKAPSGWPFRPIPHLEPSPRFYPRITAANSVGHRSKC